MVKGEGSAEGEGRDANEPDRPISLGALSALFNQQTSLFVKSEINLLGGQENE
jgi:hypothetical protein